jgi:ABC-type branched-subunit amino acid transport system permease subunit
VRDLLRSMTVTDAIFAVGLAVLCGSVAQWSGPLAGVILGAVLMFVAVWPILRMRKGQ